MSEFNKILFIFIQTSLVFCYTLVDDLKNDNYNFLLKSKFKYFSIKKNIFSPYESYNNSVVNYADSLQILLKSIENKRMLMFADIKDIELSNEDIIYIDKLNNEFIAVIRVVNDFYKILVEVSKFDNRTNYTIREYANDINSLYLLEKNIN
tara:strand:+ start:849 stop:1301 length:453 start_codon:yes stop_codon:yes gene_type:complete